MQANASGFLQLKSRFYILFVVVYKSFDSTFEWNKQENNTSLKYKGEIQRFCFMELLFKHLYILNAKLKVDHF